MAENTGEAAAQTSAAASSAAGQSLESPEQQALVTALLDVVTKLHRPLGAEEEAVVRRAIASSRQAAAALMAYPLGNADEPDTIFTPYRAG